MNDERAPGIGNVAPPTPELARLLKLARQDTGSDEQLRAVAVGLAHLIPGASAPQNPGHAAEGGASSGPDASIVPHPTPMGDPGAASILTTGSTKFALFGSAGLTKVSSALLVLGLGGLGVWAVRHYDGDEQTSANVSPASAPEGVTTTQLQQIEHVPVLPSLSHERTPRPEVAVTAQAISPKRGVASTPANGPPSELHLLREAQRLLKDNPAKALELCQKHARLHPHGQLTQEREVLVIEALRRLNRPAEASKRQDKFETQYPNSALKRRVSDKPLPSSSR